MTRGFTESRNKALEPHSPSVALAGKERRGMRGEGGEETEHEKKPAYMKKREKEKKKVELAKRNSLSLYLFSFLFLYGK